MDVRLSLLGGRRLGELKQKDLPEVAAALTAYFQGEASVGVGQMRNLHFVRIQGPTVDVVVLREDWAKLEPYIKDGTLNPALTQLAPRIGVGLRSDRMYGSILALLERLFEDGAK